MMQRDMEAFDSEHAQALRRIWFLGDVHGHFEHIGRALQSTAKRAGAVPSWLVFLGDVDLEDQPLWQKLRPLREVWPSINFAFIHGNHDADTHAKWTHLHDRGPALLLHGQVLNLDGVRVAGLGGNFQGRVWSPPAQPTLRNKHAAINRGAHQKRGAYQKRGGQQASPKFHSAIYPDDVDQLSKQRADILITHEAPSCHHHGWPVLDKLARDMRVVRTFHGHTHDDLSEVYASQREQLGFDARAVNYCCIKNGLGELVFEQVKSNY
jgi:predicted phosphodiesterase